MFVQKDDDEKESRDRTIEKAIEKITKARKKAATKKADEAKKDDAAAQPEKKPVKVTIDFDRIHERVRQVALANVTESNLFWSPDSKRLAFSATIDGRTGLFTIEIPDDLKPKPLGDLPDDAGQVAGTREPRRRALGGLARELLRGRKQSVSSLGNCRAGPRPPHGAATPAAGREETAFIG